MTEYEQMRTELELLCALADADEDVCAGRIASIEDTFFGIRQQLLERKN